MQKHEYLKKELLHKGTHFNIYSALRLSENTNVIIKEPQGHTPKSLTVARLLNEFEMGKIFQHENIIRYFELIQENEQIFLVEEYFDAISVEDFIKKKNLNIEDFLTIALQIVEGIMEIHRNQIIHQLLKPSNILINPETKQVKITGFGWSTYQHEPEIQVHGIMASAAYISPEQTGRMNRMLDYRTDFYSLGIIFYKMLTGNLPFEAKDSAEMVYSHIAKQPALLHITDARIPEVISLIVMKLLAKSAEDRYQSARGLKIDLTRCLEQLHSKGTIGNFSIGAQDFSDTLLISQKIYGREREIQSLLETFERVSAGGLELILIAGYAGIGKTVLVNEVRKRIVEKRCYFISGKFDQYTFDIPYSAIAAAFRSLIRQLLTEPEEQLKRWQKEITAALDVNGKVVVDIIPELAAIIGKQPQTTHLGSLEQKSRLKITFQKFIKVFAQKEHPLIIFLDDLQWTDAASLDLLIDVLTEPANQYMLVIGAFRDNEVSPEHPLRKTIDVIEREQVPVSQLALEPFTQKSLNQLLSDTLNLQESEIETLSLLLLEKTGGNPFFVNQFLQTIYDAGLLNFKIESSRWTWDINEIIFQNITDNLADLMVQRFQKLSAALQGLVQLCACIGNQFDLQTLCMVLEQRPNDLLPDLMQLFKNGIILPMGEHHHSFGREKQEVGANAQFKFLHDRVQQAAYDSLSKEKRQKIHLDIGRKLLRNASAKEVKDYIFHIVRHLDNGRKLLSDQEKNQLAELNLSAALKAKNVSAYALALKHVKTGMDVAQNSWEMQKELTFKLYMHRAELEYLNGNLDVSDKIIHDALSQDLSDIQKTELYNLKIILNTMSANYETAIEAGKSALAIFGEELTESNHRNELQNLVKDIEEKVAAHGITGLVDNREMSDPKMLIMIRIMANMLPLTFLSDPELYQIIAARSVILSILHGHAPESSICYSGYGILLVIMEQYQAGYEFGMLALKVSEKSQNYSQQCKAAEVLVAHLNHWINPMHKFQDLASTAYRAADQSGEIQFAGYTKKYAIGNFLFMGRKLPSLEEELSDYLSFCIKTHNQVAVDTLRGYHLFIAGLMQKTAAGSPLNPDNLDEISFLKNCHKHKSLMAICIFQTLQAQFQYLLGDYKQANESALEAEKLSNAIPGSIMLVHHLFYKSLIIAALIPDLLEKEQNTFLRQLKENQAQMKIWAGSCPENFSNMYLLVEAEIAQLNGNDFEAMELYDQAIEASREQNFIQNEAIACELCARFWLKKGKDEFAEIYLKKAHAGYSKWGAKRKVEDMETKYPQMVSLMKTALAETYDLPGGFDVNSIIKASQAISGEVELRALLTRVMQIMIENAGAQRGLLILDQKGALIISAIASGSDDIKVLQNEPIEKYQELPETVVRFVYRAGENLILNYKELDDQFAADPYITIKQPKSILCMPIRYRNKVSGVLYLENNITPNAFGEERLFVLNMLLADAAVSLENALLFEEQKKMHQTLQRSEVRFRQIFENIGVGIAIYETRDDCSDYVFKDINPFGAKSGGIAREDHIGRSVREVYPGVKDLGLLDVFKQVWQTGVPMHQPLSQYHDGRIELWVENFVSRLPSGEIMAVYQNVTEKKQAEEELSRYRYHLEELVKKRTAEIEIKNKELETFTYSVSHDLKAPLRGIDGYSRLLLEDYSEYLDEEGQTFLKNVRKSTEQMNQLIEDLLSYSRMERRGIQKADIHLTSLIDLLIAERQHDIESKKINISINLPFASLEADGEMVRHVIGNYLDNAIKFSQKGDEAYIDISGQDDDTHWTIWVKDNGIGIDPQYHDRIFRIFQRLHRIEEYPGTGVGLAIVRKAVERIGGRAWVESNAGQGATFFVQIPKITLLSSEENFSNESV